MIKNYYKRIKKIIKFSLESFKITRLLIIYNLPKYRKLKVFDKLKLKRNSTFIDIGGNEGIISQYINDKFNCKIYIYEPHPGCFNILKKKFSNAKNINVHNFAVSNTNKKQKFYFHKLSKNNLDTSYSEGASLEKKKKGLDKKKFIYANTIDIKKLIKKFLKIDVIKIDIETHEYKILPAILKNIKNIKKIYCELNGKIKYKYLEKQYDYWKKILIKRKLYGNKFIEWS